MPNNPGSRKAGAKQYSAGNKIQRGQAVDIKVSDAVQAASQTDSVSAASAAPPPARTTLTQRSL